jgi:5,10-methylenetetrahydromethanopterin reductase
MCVELARAADSAGFVSVWFAENAFARGILPAAAACAVATERLQISAGVFNPFSRHPSMMAMEIGALDELSNGRASLSIGSGIVSATAKIGFNAEKPLAALRDSLTIVHGLLRGEEVDHIGPAFSARKVKLDYKPRANIPIFLAGRGNLTVKLSGEAADGLIISNMCSVSFAGRVAELMQASRRSVGRTGNGRVIQYMPCAVHSDPKTAMDNAKRAVGEMVPGFWALGQKLGSAKDALLTGTNIVEQEFAAAAARLRAGEDAAQALDDRFAVAFSLAGTPDDCLAGAARYAEAGVTELALTFAGPTALDDIKQVGRALARWKRAH